MTMMSSLKAFLFATPTQDAMAASHVAAAGPAPGGAFATLLGDMAQAASGAPVKGDVLPAPAPPTASMPAPATAAPAASDAVAPKPLDGPAVPDAQSGAPLSAGVPVEGASPAPSMESSTPVASLAVKSLPGKQKQTAEAGPGPLPLPLPSASGQADPAAPDAVAEPEGDVAENGANPAPTADNGVPVNAAPLAIGIAPAPIPASAPVPAAAPARSAARATGAQSTAALPFERQDAPAAPPVAPLAEATVPVTAESAPVQPVGSALTLATTAFPDAPVAIPSAPAPAGASADANKTSVAKPVGVPVAAPLIPTVHSDAATPVPPTATLAQMTQAVAAVTLPAPAPTRDAPPAPGTGIGPDATPAPATAAVSSAPASTPAPARSEALSLLQLVRDHFVGRDKVAAAPDSPGIAGHTPDTADNLLQTGSAPTVTALAPQPGPAPLTPVAPMLTTAPVDLGGTLATQVVDMGVSGQWIDGLSREIASLSARGAQGSFQIDSGQLGRVQVDIRPGATGASVSLTVATDAAQQALQADGDRLIADAALSSVRIADLRIDRAPVAEAPRAETAGQQSGSSQQNPSQNQAQQGQSQVGQGLSQNLSQGAGQNRTPNRDNFAGNHKAASESAVLSQADSRDAGGDGAGRPAGRARYA